MSHCDRFGFDEAEIRRHVSMVGLDESARPWIDVLHAAVIAPKAWRVPRAVQDALSRAGGAQPERRSSLVELGREHANCWLTLGRDFAERHYFERRLGLGVRYARCPQPLELVLAAHQELAGLLLEWVPGAAPTSTALRRLIGGLVALDQILITTGHHRASIAALHALVSDLREEVKLEGDRARRDSLTTLFNREHTTRLLELGLAYSDGAPLVVAMLDIDHFKTVNDEHGHLAGDAVLREVVDRVRRALRDRDLVGRFGGDELIAVLGDTTEDVALGVLERVRASVASRAFLVDGHSMSVSLSAGLAPMWPGDDVDALIRRADTALYAAKHQGRNRVAMHAPPPRPDPS